MSKYLFIPVILFWLGTSGQQKRPEDFGFRHLQMAYNGDTVNILIKSKRGEAQMPKPLFLFCQGSLPQPLIKYDEKGVFSVFPFNPDTLAKDFHLALVSKPHIPLIAHVSTLGADYTYRDSTGKEPKDYSARNVLDYYVARNIKVLQLLQKQDWVSDEMLVVAGHSEGSTIAVRMAAINPTITHLIYSGGNPLGRILTMIAQDRAKETIMDPKADRQFKYWQRVIDNAIGLTPEVDSDKITYQFSIPPVQYLEKLKIPVLVTYGTKDVAAPYNDYLRVEMIRQKKTNFEFKDYVGTEHNYFPVLSDGSIDYDCFNWDNVAEEWKRWLCRQKTKL